MDQNKKHKKILFIGSVGSGKSTIVKHLSSIPAITCEVDSTKDIGKVSTTVGIDYGHISLNSSTRIILYGVPGQKKYSFLWKHAYQGSWGVVILVKNNDINSIKEIDFIYKQLNLNSSTLLIICITHCDIYKGNGSKKVIQRYFENLSLIVPVFSIDAKLERNSHLIIQTLTALEELKN